MKLICEVNHFDEILVKCLTMQIWKTLYYVYKINKYLLTQRDINHSSNIKNIVNY